MENTEYNLEELYNELLKFDSLEVKKAKKKVFDNIATYGQYAIHYPTLTVGVTMEDVKSKMKNATKRTK